MRHGTVFPAGSGDGLYGFAPRIARDFAGSIGVGLLHAPRCGPSTPRNDALSRRDTRAPRCDQQKLRESGCGVGPLSRAGEGQGEGCDLSGRPWSLTPTLSRSGEGECRDLRGPIWARRRPQKRRARIYCETSAPKYFCAIAA
ncbi:hypothetical protein FV228_21505 [Methylobacterium sp. WL18]|nr:hypothetical protein FV228_21505 [Methylobacterium sp. WL18]